MNAPASPGLSHLSTEKPRNLAARAILGQPLGNKALQQILDPICHYSSLRLAFFRRRVAPLKLRREHLLRRHSRLMKGHAPIRPDGVLAQF